MTVADRRKLIENIEGERQSRVVTLITGDRPSDTGIPGINTQITGDQPALLYEHLRKIGKASKIDLFLYTRGGDTSVPWVLVNLIRSACDHFAVLVPHRAHSAGTLICLGADEIVMGPAGELSPIDPATANQFNPPDPMNPGARLAISVEDVTSYIALATERIGITDKALVLQVFKHLAEQVHPLALGNVNRTHTLIRVLARKLLALHMTGPDAEVKIQQIIDILTEKLYSHLHFIGPREAREQVGLNVTLPSGGVEHAMWQLYEAYRDALKLQDQFSAEAFLGADREKEITVTGAVMESTGLTHICGSTCTLRREPGIPAAVLPNVVAMAVQAKLQGQQWSDLPLVKGLPTVVHAVPKWVGWKAEN